MRENNTLRTEGINQDLSTILNDRSKVPVTNPDEQVTMLNGVVDNSPLINKRNQFALGSLSPTSNNNVGAGHMLMDANERESQEQLHNIFLRRDSCGSQDSRDQNPIVS